MKVSPSPARKLAAARDLLAVAVFIALVISGFRAMLRSPYLQKELLTKKEAEQDVGQFFSEIRARHPAVSSSVPEAVYEKLRGETLAAAAAKQDEFERVPVRALAYELYRAAAAFDDHNTRLLWEPRRKYKDPERKYPPFHFAWRNGAFYAENSSVPALRDAKLLEINGLPVDRFLAPALERIPGESRSYKAYSFCREQLLWWEFTGLLAEKPQFSVKAALPDGRTATQKVSALAAWEFRSLSWRRSKERHSVYTQRKAAWFNAGPLAWSRAERRAYRRFFREAAGAGVTDLVLDLRDSHSGSPRMAAFILSLLEPGAAGAVFKGAAWLLIGPGTGGEAAAMAARLKGAPGVRLLGEQTGGTPAYAGDPEQFALDNSGIRFTVASRHHPFPGQPGARLQPDLEFTEALLRRFKGDVKALVLNLIETGRTGKKAVDSFPHL